MTLTNTQQEELEAKGFNWTTIEIDGREKEGYFNGEEFYEHGSGNEFEYPISIKWDQHEETYLKKY